MDKVEIKNHSEVVDPVTGKITSFNEINKNGYEYGMGEYKEFWETQVKLSFGWVPNETNSRVGLIPFGAVKIKSTSNPSYGYGIGLHFLEKGNPSTTIAGISFEFIDVNNTNNSTDDFIKRSFKISLSAAISTFSLKKK